MSDAPVIAAEFNLDEMLLLQKLLRIAQFPTVLNIVPPPDYFDIRGRDEAEASAIESLTTKGVIAGEEVIEPTVVQWTRVLQRPDVELVARIAQPPATAADWNDDNPQMGVTVCRRGAHHVVAMRYKDLLTIEPLSRSVEVNSVAQLVAPILGALGEAVVANFEAINLRASDGVQIDTRVAGGSDYHTELIRAGVAEESAQFLTDALADRSRVWRSEIVAIEYTPGKQILSEAGIGVFDTPLGRIVAAPSLALDATLWSTFAPGTNTRIVKSAELILETLPSRSWFSAVRH